MDKGLWTSDPYMSLSSNCCHLLDMFGISWNTDDAPAGSASELTSAPVAERRVIIQNPVESLAEVNGHYYNS